jgi:hypothetical protein
MKNLQIKRCLLYGALGEMVILILSSVIIGTIGNHSGMYVVLLLHFPSSLLGIYLGEMLTKSFGDLGAILAYTFTALLQLFFIGVIAERVSVLIAKQRTANKQNNDASKKSQ